jgi:hypothetical protein
MATTSIWAVRGWLGSVILYTENPEKTTNPAYYESKGFSGEEIDGLADLIAYAKRDDATIQQQLVTGVNCDTATAREEMMSVKARFGKTDGIVAYHGYQAFKPGEVAPEQAHEIGIKLAQRLWGDRFQVVVATHVDKEHIHSHFVVNSVSFIDGKKYHRTKADYAQIRETSDELCCEYGLSVIEPDAPFKHNLRLPEPGTKLYWTTASRNMPTLNSNRSHYHTSLYFRPVVKCNVYRRLTKLAVQGIFWPLYFLCYLLRLHAQAQRQQSQPQKPLHPEIRKALKNLNRYEEQVKLLWRYRIQTSEQLSELQGKLESKTANLEHSRQPLYRAANRTDTHGEAISAKEEIAKLSKQLKALRSDQRICRKVNEEAYSAIRLLDQITRERLVRTKGEHDLSRWAPCCADLTTNGVE